MRRVGHPQGAAPVEIEIDSGFATPQLYDFCEQEGLQYVIGLSRNPRLEGTVEPVLEQTRRQFGARVWRVPLPGQNLEVSRRVVAKVEVNEVGINRRFVVTNRADLSPRPLYDHYSDRGQTENYIKAFKIEDGPPQ